MEIRFDTCNKLRKYDYLPFSQPVDFNNSIICDRNSEELQQRFWYHQVFLAGCTGGMIKAIVACPIELSKVRLQITVSKLNKNLQNSLNRIQLSYSIAKLKKNECPRFSSLTRYLLKFEC